MISASSSPARGCVTFREKIITQHSTISLNDLRSNYLFRFKVGELGTQFFLI